MKGKRFLIVVGVLFLSLTLAALPFMGACAPAPPPEEAPPEVAPPEEVAPPPAAPTEILIGMTTPLSGDAAAWGIAQLRSVELIIDDYNAEGGIYIEEAGKKLPIRLIVYDDKYLAPECTINTTRLCYEDKVPAVITMGDELFIAAAPICRDAEVIHFQSPWTLDYPKPGFPLQFSSMQTVQEYGPAGVAWYHEAHPEAKNVGCIARNFAGGYVEQAIFKEVAERLGMVWVYDDVYDIGTIDFSATIMKAMDAGLDCLLTSSAFPEDLGAIIKQARGLGYTGDFLHLIAHTTVMAEIAGAENIEGSLFSIGELGEPFPPAVKAFADAYLEKYGPPLDPTAVTFWLQCNQPLFEAIEKAESLDTWAIARELETGTFSTVYGDVYYGGEEFYGLGHQMMGPIPISVPHEGLPVTVAWAEPLPYPESKACWTPWEH